MIEATTSALSCDADVVVVGDSEWFPYFREFEKLNVLIVDTGVLLRQCEIFVRGHEVPWSFAYMVWNEPWTAFYNLSEAHSFRDGLRFLELAQKRGLDSGTQDTARMLVHNRLPNLCFTRDRLLFFDMQQAAAKRAKWQRQDFVFEVGYFINFYYWLIYGGFDHLASIINGGLKLGLQEKQVGATYESFLNTLSQKAPEIHALFTDPALVQFIQGIGALRHFAAHRGSIMPGKLLEKPDEEPTPEDLDKEIAQLGLDRDLAYFPEGPIRDWAKDLLRYKVRLSKHKEIAEGVVLIEIKGKWGFISSMDDIEWNFQKFHNFLTSVLNACGKRI